MGFLSGIVHAIGSGIGDVENFFSGDNKKKAQQQQNQPQNNQPAQNTQQNIPIYQPGQNQQSQQIIQQPDQNSAAPAPNTLNLVNLQPNQLIKIPPPPDPSQTQDTQPQTNAAPANQPQPNELHKIGGFLSGVVHPFAEFGNAALHVPQAVYREIQNKPISDIQQNVFGTTDSGTIAKKIVGDTAQTMLAAATAGIGGASEAGVSSAVAPQVVADTLNLVKFGLPLDVAKQAAEEAAGKGTSALINYGSKALAGGVINTGFSGINDAEKNGATPLSVLEKIPQNFGTGAVLGAGIPAAGNLVKAGVSKAADAVSSALSSPAEEIATGVKTVNPQVAAPITPPEPAQISTAPVAGPNGEEVPQISQEAPNAQAPQIQVAPAQPPAPEVTEPHSASAMHSTETQQLQELNDKAKTAVLTPEEKTARTILQNKLDLITKANEPGELGVSDAGGSSQATVTPQQPQQSGSVTLQGQETGLPATTSTEDLQPAGSIEQGSAQNIENSSSPTNVAQSDVNVKPNEAPVGQAPAPNTATGRTAANAPKFVAGLNKKLGVASDSIPDTANARDVLSNKELSAAGKAVTDNMSDQELLTRYANPTKFATHGDTAIGNSALDRLSNIYENAPDAETKTSAMQAIKNIIDAGGEQQSSAGRVMNYGQEMLDHLPTPAKVAYYMRHIDELNKASGADEANLLSENPAKAAVVEAKLNELFGNDNTIKSQIADENSTLAKGADAATRDDVTTKELQDAYDAKKQLTTERQKNAGDFADYYKTLVPDAERTSQKLGDWQRTAMLSSPSGRVNALGGTGLNVVDNSLKQGLSGLIGKAYNAVRGTGDGVGVADTGTDAGSLYKGFKAGLRKSVNIVKGQTYADNPDAVMGTSGARNNLSELPDSGGRLPTRLVKAAVSGHQNLSSGVEDSELLRQSRTAGIQEGLSGDALDKYTLSHAGNPDSATAAQAQVAHDTINNLNDNPITRGLTKVSNGLSGIPVVGPTLKNQILPFSHFVGGNIWNTITDRNLVAAATKTVASAVKGDAQGVIDNLSSTAVEGGKAYGLGWLLTQNGIITNKDAEGNSYEGTYLHIGNRYIPVTSLGSFAPSLILGNAAYNGFHDTKNPNGSVISKVANSANNALSGAYKAYSGQQLLGGTTSLSGPFTQAFGRGNSGAPGLSKVASNVAGQFIPAATSDVNAILNNSPLNPTHEAADTKVINPNSPSGKATDQVGSAVDSLLNKIPLASQTLPRKTGVASQDILDKLTKGDQANATQIQNSANTKAAADTVASFLQDPTKVLDDATLPTAVVKAVDTANRKSFEASGKQQATINGNVYEKDTNGKTVATKQSDYNYLTQNGGVSPAQRGIDQEAFKNSGKQQDTIHGIVYQRADDGTVKPMEQKDFGFKQADDGMTQAKSSGDYTGYQKHGSDLLDNISTQLQNPNLSNSQRDALVTKAMTVNKTLAETQAYNGFNKDGKMPTFKGVGDIKGAKDGWTQAIQQNAAKYNVDPNALIAVASMEGLGGGVGDGGHAFGPFQMNDAGGVLTGKYPTPEAARAYAESPQGIEDAIKQIAGVAKGLRGQAAINAIVTQFERPADPNKEIAGANAIYNGGDASLSSNGSGTQVVTSGTGGSAGSTAAANLLKSNSIGSLTQLQASSLGKLAPAKISTSVPILQKLIPSDLVKKRSISVATVHP